MIERGANWFPAWLRDGGDDSGRRPNLSRAAQRYLERLDSTAEELFHHVLSALHDPAYREANAGALRMEWPRIPFPGWPDGGAKGAADALAQSAAWGRELARLLDPEAPVPGVTQAPLRPEIAAIAVPSTVDGRGGPCSSPAGAASARRAGRRERRRSQGSMRRSREPQPRAAEAYTCGGNPLSCARSSGAAARRTANGRR